MFMPRFSDKNKPQPLVMITRPAFIVANNQRDPPGHAVEYFGPSNGQAGVLPGRPQGLMFSQIFNGDQNGKPVVDTKNSIESQFHEVARIGRTHL